MTSIVKERLAELERRVRELEARPIVPWIIIQPSTPLPIQPSIPWWQPTPLPFYVGDHVVPPFGTPGTFTW